MLLGALVSLATLEVLNLTRSSEPLRLDNIGRREPLATAFVQRVPSDGAPASQRTEVYFGYDDEALYVIFSCFDDEPARIRARQVARGTQVRDDDFVAIQIDTFHDQRRAYSFSANPLGIQSTAMWIEGQGWDESFDTVWFSEGRLTDDGYVVSMSLPFRSLRFPRARNQKWGVMLERHIPRSNEEAYWPGYSSRIEGRLNQAALLTGIENVSPGRNLQFIPYGVFQSFRASRGDGFDEPRAGLDAKYVVEDAVVFDATVHPDFSQVESDEPQVTVNRRFELFFPEKRPFFLENASYFQTPIHLLFTRRIRQPSAGLRMTGKFGPYAVGALVADDERDAWVGAFRVSRDVSSQSTLGVMYTHYQDGVNRNRVGGVDGRIKLDANWTAAFQAVTSATRTSDGAVEGPAYEAQLNRAGRKLTYALQLSDRSPGFRADIGFEPRSNLRNIHQLVTYRFRPEGKYLVSWGADFVTQRLWDHDKTPLEMTYGPAFKLELAGQTELGLYFLDSEETLRPRDHPAVKVRERFDTRSWGLLISSRLVPEASVEGSYARGKAINLVPAPGLGPSSESLVSGDFGLVLRPVTRLTIDKRYLYTRLESAFENHIVRSGWNYQISRSLSVRAIVHYDALLARQRAALESSRNVNFDLLVTYFLHHGTALYIGYNGNREALAPHPSMLPRDQEQFFVKLSYLLRF